VRIAVELSTAKPHRNRGIMRQNADPRVCARGGTDQFKSPLAHTNEMAPDLGFYLSGRGPFVLEVLEKVLSADPEGS